MGAVKKVVQPLGALQPVEGMLFKGQSFKDTLKPENVMGSVTGALKKPSSIVQDTQLKTEQQDDAERREGSKRWDAVNGRYVYTQ